MRLIAVLLATLALTNVMAQTNAPDSFCVKYAKIVFNKNATTLTGTDEYNLISAVVARVVVGCDNNAANQFGVTANLTGTIFANYAKQACGNNGVTKVNGLVSDPLNAPFFAGTAPNYNSQTGLQTLNTNAGIPLNATFPSIRFVGVNGQSVTPNPASVGDGKGAEGLIQHLVSFFGNAFGCSSYNSTLNTPTTFPPSFIGKYNGIGNMAVVHQNMNITKPVWDEFVNTFTQSLASFGVPTADIQSMVGPIVNQFLLGSGNNQICNDKATCACANIGGINGTPATNVNGTCVANAAATTAPPTATPPASTTSPPTTHASASTVAISAATIFGAVLLAFL